MILETSVETLLLPPFAVTLATLDEAEPLFTLEALPVEEAMVVIPLVLVDAALYTLN